MGMSEKGFGVPPLALHFNRKGEKMTKDFLNEFRSLLKNMSANELAELRDQVDDEIQEIYWADENFWMREKTDSFIYITRYDDGSYYYDYIGKNAYERYLNDTNAIQLDYKTKDLFPTYGTLMRKESHEQKTV